MPLEVDIAQMRSAIARTRAEVAKVIVGQDEVVEGILIALIAGGHVLLEGVPGLGKTLIVRTIAQALSLSFSRIQFTPDLMPADITGTTVLRGSSGEERRLEFVPGPIFAQIVLADEINRATPKTQSALLEAMQEQSVTISGERYQLEGPFSVLATQNPIEMEGTYPLPEAQLDRFFFKLNVRYPSLAEIASILDRTTVRDAAPIERVLDAQTILKMRGIAQEVPIAPHVRDFAASLVIATQPGPGDGTSVARRMLRYGASPRAAQAMVRAAKVAALIDGRYGVSLDDIARFALPAMRHRLALSFEAESEGAIVDDITEQIVRDVRAQSVVKIPV
jgi:MoxR-like ATPase